MYLHRNEICFILNMLYVQAYRKRIVVNCSTMRFERISSRIFDPDHSRAAATSAKNKNILIAPLSSSIIP